MESSKLARRGFVLQGSLGLSAALGGTLFHGLRASAMPQDPPVRNPRSTDGDRRFEPDWKERLTVTVGNSREGSLSASGAELGFFTFWGPARRQRSGYDPDEDRFGDSSDRVRFGLVRSRDHAWSIGILSGRRRSGFACQES